MLTVLKAIAALAGAYILVALLAYMFQTRLVFPAVRSPLPNPVSHGFPNGERITVVTSDSVRLRGWYLPPDRVSSAGRKAPGLLWFCGNMETVGGIAPLLRHLKPKSVGLLVLDYRGYGESEGSPTEAGVYRDGEAAWVALTSRPEIDPARVAVFGRSVGSAVALHVAVHRPVAAVILDSPFTTGRAMAAHHYSWLPPSLLRMSLDNLGRARQLTQPLLVLHGERDAIAPLEMGRAIARAAHAGEIVEIPGAGHNETFALGGETYRARFDEFLTTQLAR